MDLINDVAREMIDSNINRKTGSPINTSDKNIAKRVVDIVLQDRIDIIEKHRPSTVRDIWLEATYRKVNEAIDDIIKSLRII